MCLQAKRQEWAFRLQQEWKIASSAYFLTLTYDDDNLPYSDNHPTLNKRDLQLFMKRLRKKQAKISPKPLRFYACGEYGTKTNRPHYHMILFNLSVRLKDKIQETWNLGNVMVGTVTGASIAYTTKYCITKDEYPEGTLKPFQIMSRKPGLGANYLDTHYDYHKNKNRNYTNVNGQKAALPRFYKDKIFSPYEKFQNKIIGEAQSKKTEEEKLQYLSQFGDPEHLLERNQVVKNELIIKRATKSNKF